MDRSSDGDTGARILFLLPALVLCLGGASSAQAEDCTPSENTLQGITVWGFRSTVRA